MEAQQSRWRKVPTPVYVAGAIGGVLGGCVGNALCIGYDVVNGPFLPQAGVDPQPAGWVGWWVAGGVAVGAAAAVVVSVLVIALAGGFRRSPASPGTK